jgi:hypothetical protein
MRKRLVIIFKLDNTTRLDNNRGLSVYIFCRYILKITARKKQYDYYRDQLLSFKEQTGGIEACLSGRQVKWKPLKEVLIRTKGTKITAGQMKKIHKDEAPIVFCVRLVRRLVLKRCPKCGRFLFGFQVIFWGYQGMG